MANRPGEQFNYGVRLDWLDDNRIGVISTDGQMARAAVDIWADLTIRVIREWSPEQPVLLLVDLTGPHQSYSPYVAKRTIDVYRAVPLNLTGSVAILMRDSIVTSLLMLLAQREARSLGGRITQHIFTDHDEALDWLRMRLEQRNQSTPPNSQSDFSNLDLK